MNSTLAYKRDFMQHVYSEILTAYVGLIVGPISKASFCFYLRYYLVRPWQI